MAERHPPQATTPPSSSELSSNDSPLLTFEQGRALLKMGRRWMLDRCKDGTLPHLRCGHRIRFVRASLLEWIAARERKGARP